MNSNRFNKSSPGRLVRTGTAGVPLAFVPEPLPPRWIWPNELWPLLADAKVALGRLDSIGTYISDPEMLLRSLQQREAHTSSRLEGTIARPEQVLLLELEPADTGSESAGANAALEVLNYRHALRYLQSDSKRLPLSLRLIRHLHALLLRGVRGEDRAPGEFRRQLVQIGRPSRFVPPPVNELAPCLDAFEKYLHVEKQLDPLVETFVVHYQFEAIHPFLDGNGRIGRLLLSLCAAEWCELSKPWLHMSAYFETNKDRYFDLLFEVSATNDWTSWIQFCLEGVIIQTNDAAERCRKLLDLRDKLTRKVRELGGNTRLLTAIDQLVRNPVMTIADHARRANVTYPTAKTDLERLAQFGVLKTLGHGRPKSYVCGPMMRIIYDEFK